MNIERRFGSITPVLTIDGAKSAVSVVVPSLRVIGKVACSAFKLYSLYNLYEAAFSDILCLKTLRHGTDPYAALRITIEGPDHTRAGQGGEARAIEVITGERSSWHDSVVQKKEFFVVEDFLDVPAESRLETCWNYVRSRVTVKYYSRLATVGALGASLPLPLKIKKTVTQIIMHIVSNSEMSFLGAITPTVKFHVDPSQVVIRDFRDETHDPGKITFQRDGAPALKGGDLQGALRTKHQFSVWDMGICGVVKNGLNRGLLSRISARPGQLMWGVAQLVAAVAFTVVLFPGVVPGGALVSAGFWSGIPLIAEVNSSGVVGKVASLALSIPYSIFATHVFSQI